jgi:hypothetical protein
MVQFGDGTYGEERAVEKLFRCIPEKYKQIARSIESLLDLFTMSIEEAIGHLKVVDDDEPQPLLGPITADNQKPARDDVWHNCGKLGHWVKECRQSRRGQAHVAQVEEEEPALLLAHACIKLSPTALAAAALLHLDEPRAHALLGDDSSNDKTDGWCLDTSATHHMTGRREFFTELDSDDQGSVKFGDAFGMEIKGIGSVIFTTESDEHRLLTGVYYIPALRNSVISLGQLDESGSRVEIKDEVMRIWDHHRRLLAKLTRGINRLYVLNVQVAQPLCLAARWDDEVWQSHEHFGHLHFKALKRLNTKRMVRGLPSFDHVEQFRDVCVLTKQRRLPFPQQSSFRAKERLKLVHGDLCGPVTPATPGG